MVTRDVPLNWKFAPGTAGSVCKVEDVKTLYDPEASSVGESDMAHTQGHSNSEGDTDMQNLPEQQPSTSTLATYVTPVAQTTQYDGSIPRGRNLSRARRVFRRAVRTTGTPPTSPNSVSEDIEFVDVIATIPGGNSSSANQSGGID